MKVFIRRINMEQLLELLKEVKSEIDFEKEKNLVDEGLLDSLEIVTIIAAIEDKFGIEIDPDDIDPDNFQSAEAMWEMIEKIKK